MVFIAFIENSFKHGINANIEEGFVHIFLDINDDDIQFSVVNSKESKVPNISRKVKSGGIGLVNVKRRLEILYPNKYKLEIKESPKTKVRPTPTIQTRRRRHYPTRNRWLRSSLRTTTILEITI